MTIAEKDAVENPVTHKNWMRMNYAILKIVTFQGDGAIVWHNMTVEKCKWWEQFASEEDFFEAAVVYRDGISKCRDYK